MPYTDSFTVADADALLERRDGPCVSMFIPTSRISRETEPNRIQLKNFRAEAFERLMGDHGLRRPDAETLLLPVDELLEDSHFWSYLGDGLALFLAQDTQSVFRVPLEFEPRLSVGERFILKPMLPVLSGDGTYYVLALSQNAVRVFEGTRQGVSEVKVDAMPKSMTEALVMRGREGDRPPNTQWQGDEGEKTLYRKYFLQVDRALRPLYAGRSNPVVVAGVDYLLPIFRAASGYNHLVAEGIEGNPDRLTDEEIHAKAWPLVESILDGPRRSSLERLRSQWASDLVTEDVTTILAAALDGRVETVFLDLEQDLFGTFDPDSRQTVVHADGAQEGDVELYGLAGRWTHRTGGDVYAAATNDMPDGRPIAALMRY